jgi:uncharacterized membrane protein
MNNQLNQIKEGEKSIGICFHCQEKREIVLVYTHTFYEKTNNLTMITEALKFCWKCVPLLNENYYLNYDYTVSANLLAKAWESWGSSINAESKKIMTFRVELETAEEKAKEMGERVGKIILEIGKNIPLKCLTCSLNSNILAVKRQKCRNNPRCFFVNPKTNEAEFCQEHKELKCENKNCDYQEWLKKKTDTAEPIVKKYGFIKENNIFVLPLRKAN